MTTAPLPPPSPVPAEPVAPDRPEQPVSPVESDEPLSRDGRPRVAPRLPHGVTVYHIYSPEPWWHTPLVIGLLFAIPMGAGVGYARDSLALGLLTALVLTALLSLALEVFLENEIRVFPDGVVEFWARRRRRRIPASRITQLHGSVDASEGVRTYTFEISTQPWEGYIELPSFPQYVAFIRQLRALNPELKLTGEWPPESELPGQTS